LLNTAKKIVNFANISERNWKQSHINTFRCSAVHIHFITFIGKLFSLFGIRHIWRYQSPSLYKDGNKMIKTQNVKWYICLKYLYQFNSCR